MRWPGNIHIDKLPITRGLLDLFDEESLKILVREALDNNPDLSATALRLKAAGFLSAETRSNMFPRINGGFSAGRDNQGVEAETGAQRIHHSHRISLGVSWEIDIWGRLADEYNASKQNVSAKEYEYRQARDALAARVIQTWINRIGLKRSVEIEQERVAVLEHIRKILVKRYQDGLGNLDEISTAASRTEIARADASERQTAFRHEGRTLELLLGRYPGRTMPTKGRLPEVLSAPVRTPAAVLVSRPDIQTAMARVESARLLADSAEKARLPAFNLSGQLFREAASLNSLGNATGYWSLLGSLLLPIFDGGRLEAVARAEHSELLASLMDLRATVLRAIKEVEKGFDLERNYKEQVSALTTAAGESEKSSRYYTKRYRQGLDSIQSLLIAKEQEMSVKSRLNQVITDRLSNRIDLALALGVGLADSRVPGRELQGI